jgi:hypothetical protein
MLYKLINHPDFKVLSFKSGCTHLLDEVIEFIQEPSKDELSDCMFAVGRLLGAIIGKKYISMPYDRLHIAKAVSRIDSYGHFRSKRHLK